MLFVFPQKLVPFKASNCHGELKTSYQGRWTDVFVCFAAAHCAVACGVLGKARNMGTHTHTRNG